eukprot:1100449-Amphidinium_carterae.3
MPVKSCKLLVLRVRHKERKTEVAPLLGGVVALLGISSVGVQRTQNGVCRTKEDAKDVVSLVAHLRYPAMQSFPNNYGAYEAIPDLTVRLCHEAWTTHRQPSEATKLFLALEE